MSDYKVQGVANLARLRYFTKFNTMRKITSSLNITKLLVKDLKMIVR